MKLEVCIDGIESAKAAQAGGADRLEVCSVLGVGGVTPSWGLVEQCLALGQLEVMVMVRPHEGSFCYQDDEIATMLGDIRQAKQLGAHGVVFGVLSPSGRIDRDRCRQLIDAARPLEVTFHRAFDLAQDPLEALDALLELGCERLLTSGQAASAVAGAPLIRRLVERAGDRLSVMAGGGVSAAELSALVQATGVRELHASASERVAAQPSDATLGIVFPRRVTEREKVRDLVAAMRACA